MARYEEGETIPGMENSKEGRVEEKKEEKIQIVSNEQLINLKLDRILELLQNK